MFGGLRIPLINTHSLSLSTCHHAIQDSSGINGYCNEGRRIPVLYHAGIRTLTADLSSKKGMHR